MAPQDTHLGPEGHEVSALQHGLEPPQPRRLSPRAGAAAGTHGQTPKRQGSVPLWTQARGGGGRGAARLRGEAVPTPPADLGVTAWGLWSPCGQMSTGGSCGKQEGMQGKQRERAPFCGSPGNTGASLCGREGLPGPRAGDAHAGAPAVLPQAGYERNGSQCSLGVRNDASRRRPRPTGHTPDSGPRASRRRKTRREAVVCFLRVRPPQLPSEKRRPRVSSPEETLTPTCRCGSSPRLCPKHMCTRSPRSNPRAAGRLGGDTALRELVAGARGHLPGSSSTFPRGREVRLHESRLACVTRGHPARQRRAHARAHTHGHAEPARSGGSGSSPVSPGGFSSQNTDP